MATRKEASETRHGDQVAEGVADVTVLHVLVRAPGTLEVPRQGADVVIADLASLPNHGLQTHRARSGERADGSSPRESA